MQVLIKFKSLMLMILTISVSFATKGSEASQPVDQSHGPPEDRRFWVGACVSERRQAQLQSPGGHQVRIVASGEGVYILLKSTDATKVITTNKL